MTLGLYVPLGHAVWTVALQKNPAGQGPHMEAPIGEKKANGHVTGATLPDTQKDPDGQGTVTLEASGQYCPAGHVRHELADVWFVSELNVPALQLIKLDVAAGQNVPFGHARHALADVWFVSGLYLPAEQLVGARAAMPHHAPATHVRHVD